jgi:small subunit ribosomal protein S2
VKEAEKLNIPIFAMVDTNSDPKPIDYVIPSNDDASKSIDIVMTVVTQAIAEGLVERKSEKAAEKEGKESDAPKAKKETAAAEETSTPAKETAVAEKTKSEAPAPEAKKEAASTDDAVDLTRIEGIGPKTAEALSNAGLDSFEALSGSDPERIKEILAEASSRLAHLDPGSWPKQAKMAAEGKWDELKEWQDSVKGGVE